MPKKKDWQAIRFDEQESLGTLATDTGLIQALLTSVLTHDYRCTSVVATYTMDGLTAGEGPVIVGLAHGNYSLAEIEEWIENSLGQVTGPNDLVEREVANRLIRQIGSFEGDGPLNDGKPIKTRLNWLVADGHRLLFWTYNQGSQLTTGAQVRVTGQTNGFWS